MRVQWEVVENNWPAITRNIEQNAARIVAKAALDIEAQAKARAPVLTGFLRASVQARQISATSWEVVVGAEYGAYLEYGTVHMAPRPYFDPAVQQVWPVFREAMRRVL